MTNYEKIKQLNLVETAKDRIKIYQACGGSRVEYYGDFIDTEYDKHIAIKKEIEWLKSEI